MKPTVWLFVLVLIISAVAFSHGVLVDSHLRRKFRGPITLTLPDELDEKNDSINLESEIPTQKTSKVKTDSHEVEQTKCYLPKALMDEIQAYSNVSRLIIDTVTKGVFKGKTYKNLQTFVDKFGSRITGSTNLEDSIDYMMDYMKKHQLDVHAEQVLVPHWVRGKEEAVMLAPRRKEIKVLGLGYTVGTPPGGITAEVLVVNSFEELKENAKNASGKIIVFNEDYVSYLETIKYRSSGAVEAAKVGGVAALIRSVAPFSIYSPHTGMMSYAPNVTRIPSACITIEDAELLCRLQSMGQRLVMKLVMEDVTLPSKMSRNIVGDILGREKPEEVVVVSGHIDSWDVGQGAMDDGGGMMISAQALALIKYLNLDSRRTLRGILWTAEEFGLIGGRSYVDFHRNELDKFKAVFESDFGTFRPLGLDFAGTDEAGCIVQEVLKLLAPIQADQFRQPDKDTVGSDITYFRDNNVPSLSLYNDNSKYFYFHHTEADTMTVMNSENLDLCVALWATASYVLADLSEELPRTPVGK